MVCEKATPESVLDLPRFPMTEIYIPHAPAEQLGFVDQRLCLCRTCGHAQMANVIDPQLQYGDTSGYFFRSGQSLTGRETADFFARFLERILPSRRMGLIVEIGCNDLYLLESLRGRAERLLGIDPILKGREAECSRGNLVAIGDFFENAQLDGDPDVILCKDTLEHVADPRDFLRKILRRVSRHTLLLFQFPILETILHDCRFDQVFHQHVNYFSYLSVHTLLSSLGCRLLDSVIHHDHWGSLIVAFQKDGGSPPSLGTPPIISPEQVTERYASFHAEMEQTRLRLQYWNDETIYGYGAALMVPVLDYHLGGDLRRLRCIIDDDPRKDGSYYLNVPLQIRHRNKIEGLADSCVMITAPFSRSNVMRLLKTLLEVSPRRILCPLRSI